MMKTTPWKEYTEAGRHYRIRATYGVDYEFGRRNNQQPYFSLTGEIEQQDDRRPNHWRDYSCGQIHGEIARRFPELAPYVKWHLVSLGEPMHYIANGKYWWKKAMGVVEPGDYPDAPGSPNPIDAFQKTIVFGGIPGETMPTLHRWEEAERWLRDRLPKLMGRFAADMKALKVLE